MSIEGAACMFNTRTRNGMIVVKSFRWTNYVAGLVVALLLCACSQKEPSSESRERASSQPAPLPVRPVVTVGIQVSPAMTLVMVAEAEGLFEHEGVDVEIKEFTAGKFALQALLSGAIDFAVSGEVPVALAALQGNPIRVVAQVVERTTNEVRVVAIKDKDLTDPKRYFKAKKRKLATSFGGGPEFFTYVFLNRYGIARTEIEILSQKPEDMPAALVNGSVDAIAIFDPFAFIAERLLGNRALTFADKDLYSEFYVLDAMADQVQRNPQLIEAMLRALVAASEFIERNPKRSKEVLQRYTKLEPEVIDGIWGNFVFRPALTARLLEYWQAQAQWAKDTGKVTPDTPTPDFHAVIEPKFLRRVAPEWVRYQTPKTMLPERK